MWKTYRRFVTVQVARERSSVASDQVLSNPAQEIENTDNDVKAKFNQYNSIKTNLASLQRRQT